MGTLASQTEIGVWVQAPGALVRRPGVLPPEKFWDFVCKILQSTAFLAFVNTITTGTPFPCASDSFLAMVTPRVCPRNDPCSTLPHYLFPVNGVSRLTYVNICIWHGGPPGRWTNWPTWQVPGSPILPWCHCTVYLNVTWYMSFLQFCYRGRSYQVQGWSLPSVSL